MDCRTEASGFVCACTRRGANRAARQKNFSLCIKRVDKQYPCQKFDRLAGFRQARQTVFENRSNFGRSVERNHFRAPELATFLWRWTCPEWTNGLIQFAGTSRACVLYGLHAPSPVFRLKPASNLPRRRKDQKRKKKKK